MSSLYDEFWFLIFNHTDAHCWIICKFKCDIFCAMVSAPSGVNTKAEVRSGWSSVNAVID